MKRLTLAVGVSTRINIFAAEQASMERPLKPNTVFFCSIPSPSGWKVKRNRETGLGLRGKVAMVMALSKGIGFGVARELGSESALVSIKTIW